MFECGDGSCVKFQNACMNKRNLKLLDALWLGTNLSDNCLLNIACFTRLHTLEFRNERCKSLASTYIKNILQYCPVLIALPPILFGHVRFVYTNNQTQVSE